MTAATPQKRVWQPMKLEYVGHVGELMHGGTGSRADGGNPGHNKGQGPG